MFFIFRKKKEKRKKESSQCLKLTQGFFMSSYLGCFDFMLFCRSLRLRSRLDIRLGASS